MAATFWKWILAFIVSLLPHGPSLAAEAPNPSPPSLLVILQGYLANRDSFPFVSSEFLIVETRAASVDAGLRGVFNAPQIAHRGFWYRNGQKERLRVSCNKDVLKEIREHKDNSIPIVLEDYLTDGKYRMKGGQAIGIINFFQPARPSKMHPVTPFYFFGSDFDRQLTNIIANPKLGKVNGFVNWKGHELVSVTFSYPSDPSMSETYSFDPKQGYLPWVERSGNQNMTVHKHIVEVKRIPDNRWFPMKWIFIQHLHGNKEEIRVRTLEVTSLNVSTPPPDSAFDFDLSEYFQVSDPDRPSSVYTLKEGERVEVGKMQAVADKLDMQVSDRSRPSPPGAESLPQRINPYWRAGILAVPLILLGLFLIWRYRRRKKVSGDSVSVPQH